MQSVFLSLESLSPDSAQPRTAIPDEELHPLIESIRTRGLLLPLRVRPADNKGRHVIVSGHRRFAALQRLGHAHAPCIIVEGPLDEATVLAEQLAENVIRQNLSPIEEAEGYRRYIGLKQITAAQAAHELNVGTTRISRLLALLELPPEVRTKVHEGVISQEAAYYLSRLPEGEEQKILVDRAMQGNLSRDEAARAVKAAKKPADSSSVSRITCKLKKGRSLTISGEAINLDSLIETLEDVLRESRKARLNGLGVSTLARVFRDRSSAKNDPSV